MAHGYAAVKEHGIARFADAFADAGFVVLLHDHRTFGISGGEPRQDVDPWRQVADWRRAISYLECRPEVDSKRSVSPTPLLMIVASHDTITLTDLALASYERALEPKKLVFIPGGHFDPYLSGFQISCGAAVDWFRQHLDG
jgi:fermentation-respiration switch protein FrsA (DUF1100 family)